VCKGFPHLNLLYLQGLIVGHDPTPRDGWIFTWLTDLFQICINGGKLQLNREEQGDGWMNKKMSTRMLADSRN